MEELPNGDVRVTDIEFAIMLAAAYEKHKKKKAENQGGSWVIYDALKACGKREFSIKKELGSVMLAVGEYAGDGENSAAQVLFDEYNKISTEHEITDSLGSFPAYTSDGYGRPLENEAGNELAAA